MVKTSYIETNPLKMGRWSDKIRLQDVSRYVGGYLAKEWEAKFREWSDQRTEEWMVVQYIMGTVYELWSILMVNNHK